MIRRTRHRPPRPRRRAELLGALVAALVAAPLAGGSALAAQDASGAMLGADTSRLVVDRIVAIVGTQPILFSEVLADIRQREAAGVIPRQPRDSAELVALQREVLNDLIDAEVLVQAARADTAVQVDEALLESQADQMLEQIRGNFATAAEFRAALASSGFGSQDEFRTFRLAQMRREALQQNYIQYLRQTGKYTQVNVPEEDVTAEIERLAGQFPVRPPSMGFQQIVVGTVAGDSADARARATIDSLYDALEGADTETFAEAARAMSQDPGSARNGGDLGWNRRGVMVPEFDRVMFAINPGIVSLPVKTQYGYHIIRVEKVMPAEVKASHILIRPATDSADVARSRARADSALALWRTGVPFDSVRVRFHDIGEDALIPGVNPDELPEPYREGIGDAGPETIVGPFAIPDQANGTVKWVVLKVLRRSPGGPMTEAEARTELRRRMQQVYSYRRLLDGLRDARYVSIRLP